MAVDYVLEFSCEVRKSVPEAKLVALVGYMSLAEFAVGEIRKSNPALPMDAVLQYEVRASQTRPDGVIEQVPMTIAQLVKLAQPLAQYRGICAQCRANIADRPFGCIAKINYPIRKESEEWLLSRLPADIKDPNLTVLFRLLSELKIDGRTVDALRPKLFDLKAPLVRRWGAGAEMKQVTSSQYLHLLAFGGNIGPKQAAIYSKILALDSVLTDPHPPSSNIEQFKTLMCAVVMGGRLSAGIVIDT